MTQKESDSLKIAVISEISRDPAFAAECHGTDSFSSLLGIYVNSDCTETAAARHWKSILDLREIMGEALGRPVSLHTAIADYCTQSARLLSSPFLVDAPVFRNTQQQAMIDPLTGTFNRRYMDISLRKEYHRCERWGKSLSLCIIDIDNFKRINDTMGHPFGDKVLVRLSEILRDTLRDEDVLCRFGGEEFLAILPETDEQGVRTLAGRLRTAVKQDPFLARHHVAFSAGLSSYPDIQTVDGLLAAADRALYQAKYNGKDQAVPATPERRKHDRFPYAWELSVVDEGTSEEVSGITTLNVSLGGAQFTCDSPYGVDRPLQLMFRNSGTGMPEINAEAHISWVKKLHRSFLYGVRFDESPNPLRQRLLNQAMTVERA